MSPRDTSSALTIVCRDIRDRNGKPRRRFCRFEAFPAAGARACSWKLPFVSVGARSVHSPHLEALLCTLPLAWFSFFDAIR